ncbi:MAG: carboxylating nicotinate-nucleotide diphosphorylase [Cytophagaceae bacterium]
MNYLKPENINAFIDAALSEDIGEGDFSTQASIPEQAMGEAELIIKGTGLLAGVEMAGKIFERIDPGIRINFFKKDGDRVSYGDRGFYAEGPVHAILKGERLVLNCMQRMSGIATYADFLTNKMEGTKAKLLDTRKTTPNFRIMEKWAVAIGGGTNHRFGLYDMVMLKDNHIDYAGGITKAVASTKQYLKDKNLNLKIEVETRNLEEVREAASQEGIFRILLDNMNVETLKEAVQIVHGKFQTEASGGITEENIQSVARTGVDYISVGALTHSYKSLDISLKAKIK